MKVTLGPSVSNMMMIRLVPVRGGTGRNMLLSRHLLGPSSTTMPSRFPIEKFFSRRLMSDNLLGHNPMAQHNQVNQNKNSKPLFGVDSNTDGGGVWAQTSAKRDKIIELRAELSTVDKKDRNNLDSAATDRELLDLQLVDGLRCVSVLVDAAVPGENDDPLWTEWNDYLIQLKNMAPLIDAGDLDKSQWQLHVESLLNIVRRSKEEWQQQAAGEDKHPLVYVRDFMPYPHPDALPKVSKEEINIPPEIDEQQLVDPIRPSLQKSVVYLRLLLLEQLLEEWSENNGDNIWAEFVSGISNADIDRAAAQQKIVLKAPSTISLTKFINVMKAYTTGSCADRVEALWNLKDFDNDGLIDQDEMNTVVHASVRPIQRALPLFFQECINAHPLDCSIFMEEDEMAQLPSSGLKGWRRNRKLAKDRKILTKTISKTVNQHMDIEVEIAHRLRCTYAWAEKSHQEGKIESVLVDDNPTPNSKEEEEEEKGFLSFGGRKRYVELQPKISFEEFKSVQREHFSHLDRVMEELCKSLKEDLWILQGKKRQRQELKRECTFFLIVVTAIDIAIQMA